MPPTPTGGKNVGFTAMTRLARARAKEFSLVDTFKLGYRNREDITKLPPGVLIVGSQNMITNVSDRVQIRKGYALDGATSSIAAPILASFDWQTYGNGESHLRAGFLTSAGNDGKLQYRYVSATGVVTWRDLITSLTTVSYNFTDWWNPTEKLREVLFVNGTSNIYEWNGATTTLSSKTVNTLTKSGTDIWATAGFYTALAGRSVVINGNTYTYTGGETTTTLTGVAPDPSGEANGSVIHQSVVTNTNASMTGISATFTNGLISTLNNQIYIASLTSSIMYLSKVDSFTDYSFSTPRQIKEGWTLTLDANAVAFMPQENFMYVSAGKDLWYNINFSLQTSTVGVTYEQVNALRLKTGPRQGVISQAFVSHMKNNILSVTNETTIDTFGRIETSLATPQTTNLSDPIKLDVDSYNFTNGSIFYHRYNIYVAVPAEGLVLIYNLATKSWETPQTLPISRFYTVSGELYGHSYAGSESYQLFTGYADRVYTGFSGFPISAKAVFSYENYGSRFILKKANAFYVEGYITPNTSLTCQLTYELDGCQTMKTFKVDGSDKQIVCIPSTDGSLGSNSLGKIKLGGSNENNLTGLPPKFRVEKTFNNTNFFEVSPSFSVLGVDNRFELLGFGLNAGGANEEAVAIRQ